MYITMWISDTFIIDSYILIFAYSHTPSLFALQRNAKQQT